ncbi:hypothetical protein Patl1_19436 [Pistacia atlantica]|uniref:Uncharacterized protein n=1 Tax=Pistacia atlantica TaxID=434234 RepID=A0ACC1BYN6_9ROSI|nr:hypothetical protein Patl1_19436 [Pistacia atlantica]
MRATPLAPSEWRSRLEAVKDSDEASNSNLNTNLILLDSLKFGRLRLDPNLYHLGKQPHPKPLKTKYPVFPSPLFLPIFSLFFLLLSFPYLPTLFHLPPRKIEDVVITFNQIMNETLVILMVQEDLMWTALGALHLGNLRALASDPLANVDKEKTRHFNVLYRRRCFHYLKNEGPVEWVGNLFMFDSRLSLPPSTYKPEAMTEARKTGKVSENPFATCYICD